MWTLDEAKRSQYTAFFQQLCADAGGVTVLGKASAGLSLSGLPVDTLMAIWALSDLDGDDHLNLTEYLICCLLIAHCIRTGGPPPATVPPELVASATGDAE